MQRKKRKQNSKYLLNVDIFLKFLSLYWEFLIYFLIRLMVLLRVGKNVSYSWMMEMKNWKKILFKLSGVFMIVMTVYTVAFISRANSTYDFIIPYRTVRIHLYFFIHLTLQLDQFHLIQLVGSRSVFIQRVADIQSVK